MKRDIKTYGCLSLHQTIDNKRDWGMEDGSQPCSPYIGRADSGESGQMGDGRKSKEERNEGVRF